MTTLTLKVPAELFDRLNKVASELRTSRSEVCRQALEQRLRKVTPTRRSLHDLSRDLCGSGSSGIGDLSSNKKHLEGFGA